MPLTVSIKDFNFDNVICEKFEDKSSGNGGIKWVESIIKYKYAVNNGGVVTEVEGPLIVKFPELNTNYGLNSFENDEGNKSFSISVLVDEEDEVHKSILDFYEQLRETFFKHIESNYSRIPNAQIKNFEVAKKSFGSAKGALLALGFLSMYKDKESSKNGNAYFNFKVNYVNEKNVFWTDFLGIDGEKIDPIDLIKKKFSFFPYVRFPKIFCGSLVNCFQQRLTSALLTSISESEAGLSIAHKDAEEFMINNPEKSKIFAENKKELKAKAVNQIDHQNHFSDNSNMNKSNMNKSKMNSSSYPVKPQKDILEGSSDDEGNSSGGEETSPIKQKNTKTVKKLIPKGRGQ